MSWHAGEAVHGYRARPLGEGRTRRFHDQPLKVEDVRRLAYSLVDLHREGRITKQNALAHADSRNDLGLAIRMLDQEKTEKVEIE